MNICRVSVIVLVLLHVHSHGMLQRYGGLAKRLSRSAASKKKFLKPKKSFATRKKFVRFYSTKATPPEQGSQYQNGKGLFGYLSALVSSKFAKPRGEAALYDEHVKILDEMFHVAHKNYPQEMLLPQNRKNEIKALHKQLFDRMVEAQKNGEVVLLSNIPRVKRICFELEKSKINKDGTARQKELINDQFAILNFTFHRGSPRDWETSLLYKGHFRKETGWLKIDDQGYIASVMSRLFYYPMTRYDIGIPVGTSRVLSDFYKSDLDLQIKYEEQNKIIHEIEKYSNYSGTFPHRYSDSEIVALILKKNNPFLKPHPTLKAQQNAWKHNNVLIFDEKNDTNLTIDSRDIGFLLSQNDNFRATTELFISNINPIDPLHIQNLENEIERIIREFKGYRGRSKKESQRSGQEQHEERQVRQKGSKITRQEAFRRLAIPENTPLQEIKKQFLTLAKEKHPDRYKDPVLKDKANKELAGLIEAYHVLIGK